MNLNRCINCERMQHCVMFPICALAPMSVREESKTSLCPKGKVELNNILATCAVSENQVYYTAVRHARYSSQIRDKQMACTSSLQALHYSTVRCTET